MGFANHFFLVGGPTSYLNKIGIYFQRHQQDVSLPCGVVFNGDGWRWIMTKIARRAEDSHRGCTVIAIYIYLHTYIYSVDSV